MQELLRGMTEVPNSSHPILQTVKKIFGSPSNPTSNPSSERKLFSFISQHNFGQPKRNCTKLKHKNIEVENDQYYTGEAKRSKESFEEATKGAQNKQDKW